MLRLLLLMISLPLPLLAQNQSVAPESPRKAVLEIMFGDDSSALLRRLPSAVQVQLAVNPDLANEFLRQLARTNRWERVETFETGPVLAVEKPRSRDGGIQFDLVKEDLRGDEAEMEIGIRELENEGQPPVAAPYFSVRLRLEDGTWRMAELTFGTRIRLDDAKQLDGFFLQAAQRRPLGNESSAVGSVRTINTAQVTYASTYPEIGFTCSLAVLDGPDASQPSPEHAMLIHSKLASGRNSGYIFALSGCSGSPINTYQVTAVPEIVGKTGKRAFCSDQTGILRFSSDGSAETCLAQGEPLQ